MGIGSSLLSCLFVTLSRYSRYSSMIHSHKDGSFLLHFSGRVNMKKKLQTLAMTSLYVDLFGSCFFLLFVCFFFPSNVRTLDQVLITLRY